MPVFRLTDKLIFPNPELSGSDGIVALEGDLSVERIVLAYQSGIFPWYASTEPIIWWSPDPRTVLFPEEIHISKSMRPVINSGKYKCTFDQSFEEVIKACAEMRKNQDETGTWLHPEMQKAYIDLHQIGIAHSVEVWFEDKLVGGLYGIAMGQIFFGESMFSRVSNASKMALIYLSNHLIKKKYKLIDCQVYTEHLASMGAKEISRREFLSLLPPVNDPIWDDQCW